MSVIQSVKKWLSQIARTMREVVMSINRGLSGQQPGQGDLSLRDSDEIQGNILAGFLKEAGFVQVQRVTRHGIFQDTSDMVFAGVGISLNMTARCPVTVVAANPSRVDSAVSA